MEYINEYLPEDIAVLSCEAVPERFHSRLSAVKKHIATSWKWERRKMFSEKLLLWSGEYAGCRFHERGSSFSYRHP